jgi:FtsP/CotA-like multicopper oxidase with cupredoxin domain
LYQPQWSRRRFLRSGSTLAAAAALPAALYGCRSDDESSLSLPDETFVQPQALRSANGVLDVTLNLAYLSTVLDGKAVTLRAFNGSIPGPTLYVDAGDTLRIRLVNNLPPNPPSSEPVSHLRYPNSTNLHTHGLHVSPAILAPGLYGDFVMDEPAHGVAPGESRQHEYRIGADHPPGAYWYHPHLHGASAIQVASGVAGALLVRGEIDKVPEIAAARERVFVFQAPITDASGRLESFVQVADDPANESTFLINGVRRPRLVMRRGEVQKWHFLNAAIFNFLNLSLDRHAFNLYGWDGNTRRTMTTVEAGGENGVVLAPGNRASVLVRANEPGTYLLRSLPFRIGGSDGALPEDILAEVLVVDPSLPMDLPAGPLPVSASLAPITDEELAAAGGLKRYIVLRTVPYRPYGGGSPGEASPGDELQDWVFETGHTSLADKVYALGAASGQPSTDPQMPSEYIPFQSSRAITQRVPLGSVEEWTIFNMNGVAHPFHIHVNPFQVIAINGQPIEPYWADTVALPPDGNAVQPTSVTFRTRFRDYAGPTVMHCHMLAHEDMGMMQRVEIV